MRILFRALFFLIPLLPITPLCAQQAQEVLVGLHSMPLANHAEKNGAKITLELPFFDDFARGQSFPTSDFWNGAGVFVNTTYGINPPSIGVATFDAYNHNGNLYPAASALPFSADTLTSHPINLNFPLDTTIYLSFVFQPQGLGFQPSIRDSLILEFYDSLEDQWIGVWAAWVDMENQTLRHVNRLSAQAVKIIQSDSLHRTFHRVHFPILGEQYLNEGFRFRFRNYASLQQNTSVPGLIANCDHWHIDQVYIDRHRAYNDTLLYDITFARPLGSVLKNYESVPWTHFNTDARANELTNPMQFKILYRNLNQDESPDGRQVTRRFSIYNHSNDEEYNFSAAAENIPSLSDFSFTREYVYDFQSAWADSARYTFTAYLVTEDPYPFCWNDTVSYSQEFKNFYALDDGSAEGGYGIFGEGAQAAQVAVKYTSYKEDKLVGLYMYFNRTKGDANQKYFKLAVWDDNNGKPGKLVYQQLGLRPLFADSLNRFVLYKINEELILPKGIFYIGWIQTTAEMLNVGFDKNRNNSNKIFYNIGGQWSNTAYNGSLMLRPAFGKLTESPTHSNPIQDQKPIAIYPNPATNQLWVQLPDSYDQGFVQIFNLVGQQLMATPIEQGNPLNISMLSSGTYIVRVTSNGEFLGTKKLVVTQW